MGGTTEIEGRDDKRKKGRGGVVETDRIANERKKRVVVVVGSECGEKRLL